MNKRGTVQDLVGQLGDILTDYAIYAHVTKQQPSRFPWNTPYDRGDS